MRAHALIRTSLAAVALALGLAAAAACSTSSGAPAAQDGGDGGSCPSDLPASCPSPAPSFDTTVFPAIQRRCWGCHADGGVEVAQHDFSTYDTIYPQRRSLLTQVYGCTMPPPDAAAPTADERAAILAWLVCGAPRN